MPNLAMTTIKAPSQNKRVSGKSIQHACCVLLLTLFAAPANGQSTIEVSDALVSIIEQVRVPSLREGAIVKLHVAEGDSVTVGQLLARIDDRAPKLAQAKAKSEYETALQVAQSDLAVQLAMKKYELAMSDLRRVEQARSLLSGSVTDEEYENRRLQVERAELEIVKSKEDRTNAISQARLYANDYRSAELNLKQTEVLSPIAGTVVSIERHEGEWAKTGETILELLGTTRLKAEAMIDVAQIHQPLVGRRVVLFATMPDGSSKKFRGVVRFENPEINPLDNRVSVWAEISNAPLGDGPRLRPGTRGRMVIDMTDRAFAKQTISTRSAESATTEK